MSQGGSAGVLTRLQVGPKDWTSFTSTVQQCLSLPSPPPPPPPKSYRSSLTPTRSPVESGGSFRGGSGRGLKPSVHLNLIPRFRIREFIPSLPPYACMVWSFIRHREILTFSMPYLSLADNMNGIVSDSTFCL